MRMRAGRAADQEKQGESEKQQQPQRQRMRAGRAADQEEQGKSEKQE
jgi:hypothetical protein